MSKEERILTYVAGILHFYGAMRFGDLFVQVTKQLPVEIDLDDFRVILEQAVGDEDSQYPFDMEGDYYFDIDVEDPKWVIAEQKNCTDIPFRPVSEDDAIDMMEDYEELLLTQEKKFLYWIAQKSQDKELALAIMLEYGAYIKNGGDLEELIIRVAKDMGVSEEEQSAVTQLVVDFAMNLPLWSLKGWRPVELTNKGGFAH